MTIVRASFYADPVKREGQFLLAVCCGWFVLLLMIGLLLRFIGKVFLASGPQIWMLVPTLLFLLPISAWAWALRLLHKDWRKLQVQNRQAAAVGLLPPPRVTNQNGVPYPNKNP